MATDGDLEVAHARERFPVQGHLVEAEHLPAPLVAPHHAHHQHRALLHAPAVGEELLHGPIQLAEVGLGQETQVAGVDREDRHADRCGLARGGEHGAVTPQHHRQTHLRVEARRHAGAEAAAAQVLVGIGEAHHAAGAADPQHAGAGRLQAALDDIGRLDGQILAVVDDQSDAGHRSEARTC